MMELGATICTPRAPQCLLCPVAKILPRASIGHPESFPEKRKKRDTVEIVLAAAVLTNARGRTLLLPPPRKTQNKPAADDVATLVSRMWHFPTVAIRKNPRAELRRNLSHNFFPRKMERFAWNHLQKCATR